MSADPRSLKNQTWTRGAAIAWPLVDGNLTILSVRGQLTLEADLYFARRLHELAEAADSDAEVVDFTKSLILFNVEEVATALTPLFAMNHVMPRPLAIVCAPNDLGRCNEFAAEIGHSRAVRHVFCGFNEAVAWSKQKGHVWRSWNEEGRREVSTISSIKASVIGNRPTHTNR